MADYTNLKNSIRTAIKANGNNEITGNLLQQILIAMVSNLGAAFQFAGVATQSTNPGTPDYNVAYLAGPGTYQNMGGSVVPSGYIGVIAYNGSWGVQLISVGGSGGGSVITFNSLPNGTTEILVDGVPQAVIPSQYTLLKLSAFTTTPSGLADGSYYYNTSDKKIYQKRDPSVAVIPYYDGAIYTYNNALYVWNGTDLVNVGGGGGGVDFLTEPDDLALVPAAQQGDPSVLKFANRSYNSENPNGMGYKILRKDLTFAEQVTEANTIYEIRYNFVLNGNTYIPSGSILLFNGGSISNGALYDIGKVINARIGCISSLIQRFADYIKVVRTSEYGVGVNSEPAFNKSFFQSAINQQIAIEVDTTANVSTQQNEAGFDYGITFNEPLYITDIRVSIRGIGFEGGALYFPNGDAFVYNQKKYYSHNCFENLTISAKRFVFNFVNCETEGTVNANRPYNIYQSVFRNLRVKSLESDCFYQGGVVGVGGDAAMMFQNLFSNISLWTPRYGFNGLNGQTDFVVEHLTDVYVPESFFYNTFPNVVRYVNSSFSGTKNFMRFGGDLTNYDIRIRCEYCSFEDYTEEIFIDTALSTNPTRNYRVSLYKCGFSYSNSLFPSGKVELFPIKLNSIREFVLRETPEPSIGYGTNFGIMWSTALNNIDVDIPVKLYYGYNSQQTYYGYYEARPLMSKRQTIAGSYPNYVMPQETDFLKAVAMMADSYGFNPETIDVSSNRTPTIKTTFAVFSASAAAQIDYVTLTPIGVLGGVASQTAYNQFGKFLLIYNSSDYNITFNNGYANSLVAEDTPFLVMRPKEFFIAIYDFSKQANRLVVVTRLNGLVKYGNTNQRPTLTAYEAGFTFYDRQLLKMILWNGTAWVNVDGTAL